MVKNGKKAPKISFFKKNCFLIPLSKILGGFYRLKQIIITSVFMIHLCQKYIFDDDLNSVPNWAGFYINLLNYY